MNDATGRVLRSVLQLVAGGGLAALVAAVANGLSPTAAAALSLASALLVIVAQNFAEAKGVIPPLLKPKVVGEVVDKAGTVVGGVVGATVGEVAEVAGTVINDVGDIVGAVAEKDNEEAGGE